MTRPKHSKSEIEDALRRAEDMGWKIEKAGPRAKPWGAVKCPQASRDGCRMSIWSTPKSAANHAKQILRAIDACPHRPTAGEGAPEKTKSENEKEADDENL
ncbi:hypothetical protein WJT74_06580 [Sphingomicrobium sp. XHP0239]|uniref:hypothetical protein n=1 Tax=Sphingomicrobium maritimum TaxID=3133972 RepID=UPI0031CCB79D